MITETRGNTPPRDRRRVVVGTVVGLLTVVASLGAAELVDTLDSAEDITVLAPANAAFGRSRRRTRTPCPPTRSS
ncbi:fasciclin domain-containing protein [Nocardiopsis halotolerans]|uniref:fasciclin domain-containing protein n=1 Tax=Nocardiopsis halotolerans TaxID=124252 RepID=UPI00034AF249|nr:fasciclin domain-containing protein [Nocardiopsis halotolerans]